QDTCLGWHFSGGQHLPPEERMKEGIYTHHSNQVGSERGYGLLDGVCRA
ncbi:unnamed protein product, partial [Staurois parvus]